MQSIAQTGVMRGHVYDEKSGEPILFGNVLVDGTTIGTTTDLNGFFTFPSLPIGKHKIVATFLGYDTAIIEVTITEGAIAYGQIFMKEGGIQLGTIDISAKREQARSEVKISQLQVSKKDIELLPSTGGDADLIQYLQVLPGIVTTGDQGGQIFIRGGSPVQNKILLDGLTIYNPFHSIGFYSVFETELIKNVDVLTGGFGAEHGGRISAIVDITTREGNKKNFGGQVTASPFMLKGLIEGPIIKLNESGAAASFVLTHKESIIDQTSQSLYRHAVRNDTVGLPFNFSDSYGKLSFVTAAGSRFNLFGFNFTDRFNDPNLADIGWSTAGGGLNFTLLPATSNLTLNGIIGFSDYNTDLSDGSNDERSSRIREYVLGIDFTFYGVDNEVNYGLEVKSIRTEFDFLNPFNQRLSQFQNTTEIGAFLKYRQVWGPLVLEPSFRYQFYASLGQGSFEPRLGLKYNITDKLRFKLAAGLYSQNLISTSNERDVVQLFTGFLSGPEERIMDLNGGFTDGRFQTSRHAIAGFEIDLAKGLEVNVEGFVKDFPRLIIVNRNKLTAQDPDFATEEGRAVGIDFSLKYGYKKWSLWSTYSLGRVTRFDGIETFPTVFDRRHNVNFLLSYTFDDKGDWTASARWNLGSGFPFTQTQAFFNSQNFFDGLDTDILTSNPDDLGIIFSDVRNGGRLPYFHRLDLSMTYKYHFSERLNAEIVTSITNAYDRNNIFFFDRVLFERVDQLPVIPSVAIKFNF